MTDYRNDEFTKIEKAINFKTKEELIATVQMLIFMHDLKPEDVCVLVVGQPTKLAKLFPGVEFSSVDGLLYKFAIMTNDRICIHCVAYDNGNENEPIRTIIYKRQDV